MSPEFTFSFGDRKGTDGFEALRRGRHQRYLAFILIVAVEHAVGVNEGTFVAQPFILIDYLARIPIQANPVAPGESNIVGAIDIIAQPHLSAVVGVQGFIHPFAFDLRRIVEKLYHRAAVVVPAGGIDGALVIDGYVGIDLSFAVGVIFFQKLSPEQFAGLGLDRHDGILQHGNDHAITVMYYGPGIAIRRWFREFLTGPDHLAGYFIQGHHARFGAAGRADHFLPVDVQTFRHPPVGIFAVEFGEHVPRPDFIARFRLKAGRHSVTAKEVEPSLVDRRRRAGAGI